MNETAEILTPILPDLALELTLLTGEMFQSEVQANGNHYLHGETCSILASLRTWPHPYRFTFQPAARRPVRDCIKTSDFEITCSTDRTPAAIARDIKNRLLENARKWTDENFEYWKKAEESRMQREAAELILIRAGFDELTYQKGTFYTENITARYYLDGLFTLEIRHVTPEQAVEIYRLIKGE